MKVYVPNNIMLTFEQFELHGSIYTWIFFSSKYAVNPQYPQVLHPQIQPTMG